jgi:hypothetical protein
MNLLFSWMKGHPEVVDAVADSDLETVRLAHLIELIGSEEFPLVLDWDLVDRLRAEEPLGQLLEEAYLPILSSGQWAEAMEQAEAEDSPPDYPDWVAFAASENLGRGVTMPDDGGATMRISLFTRLGSAVRRLSLDYGSERQPVAVSLSLGQGCSLPDWGNCSGEECEGDCSLRRAPRQEGLVCRCPHQ